MRLPVRVIIVFLALVLGSACDSDSPTTPSPVDATIVIFTRIDFENGQIFVNLPGVDARFLYIAYPWTGTYPECDAGTRLRADQGYAVYLGGLAPGTYEVEAAILGGPREGSWWEFDEHLSLGCNVVELTL